MSNHFKRLSAHRTAQGLFAAITLSSTLVVHSIVASVYWSTNSASLQILAKEAVTAGAQYLPQNPRVAIWIADAYATRYGISPSEIAFTGTEADNLTLTIRLCRIVPWHVAMLAVGLPDRTITVTAKARLRNDLPLAPLRKISW